MATESHNSLVGTPDEIQRQALELKRLARGLLLDRSEAEDVVQDAWLAILQRPAPLGANLSAWLGGVVRKLSANQRRSEARRKQREEISSSMSPKQSSASDESSARVEVLKLLLGALDQLEPNRRSVLVMRYFDDLPPREVARRLGMPVNTVRSHTERGLAQLRRHLDASGGDRRELLGALAPFALGPTLGQIIQVGGGQAAIASAEGSASRSLQASVEHGIQHNWQGGFVVGSKAKVAAVLLLATGGWWIWKQPSGLPAKINSTSPEPAAVIAKADSPTQSTLSTTQPESPKQEATRKPVTSDNTLAEQSWSVKGLVVSSPSQPLPNVELEVQLELLSTSDPALKIQTKLITSGQDGSFEAFFSAPEDSVNLRVRPASKSFLHNDGESAFVRAGQAAPQIVLSLYPLDVELRGRVVDESGNSIASAIIGSGAERDLVRSNADGSFTLPFSSLSESARLNVRAAGFMEVRHQTPLRPGVVQAADVVLPRGVAVTGLVTDSRGQPVVEAEVSHSVLWAETTQTDSEGRFRIDHYDPSKDSISLYISHPLFCLKRVKLDPSDETQLYQEVTLDSGSRVVGTVRDERGKFIPGIEVLIGPGPGVYPQITQRSDANGHFEFPAVQAGEDEIWCEALGYQPFRQTLEVPPTGGKLRVELVLQRGRSVRGRVVDSNQRPLSGVPLSARLKETDLMFQGIMDGYAGPRQRTDAKGEFQFDSLPFDQEVEILAFAKGFARLNQAVPTYQDEVLMVLEYACCLSGQVLDGITGKPLDEFTVFFRAPKLGEGQKRLWGYSSSWSSEGRTFKGTQGVWDTGIEELRPHTFIGLEVRAAGYAAGFIERAETQSSPTPSLLVAQLFPGVDVFGTVQDGQGMLLSDVPVSLHRGHLTQPGEHSLHAKTDANGRFQFKDIGRGQWSLRAEPPNSLPLIDGPFEVSASHVERFLQAEAGVRVAGFVRTATDQGIPGQRVALYPLGKHEFGFDSLHCISDSDGSFTFSSVPPGSYQLFLDVEHDNGTLHELSRVIQIDTTATQEFILKPEGNARVQGDVTSAGKELDGLVVNLIPQKSEQGLPSRSTLALDGKFQFENVQPGDYMAICHYWGDSGDNYSGHQKLLVQDNGNHRVALEMEKR